MIPLLLSNVTNPQSTVPLKQATLEAIGYICEEIVSSFILLCWDDVHCLNRTHVSWPRTLMKY